MFCYCGCYSCCCCCCCFLSLQSCPTLWPHRRQPTRLRHPWDSPGKNTGVGCHFLLQCMKVKRESEVAQSSPTLRDPMDGSPPGSSVHGIFQARVLEWGAIAFSIVSVDIRIYSWWFLLYCRPIYHFNKWANNVCPLLNTLFWNLICLIRILLTQRSFSYIVHV